MPPFTRRQFIGYGAAVPAAAAVVPVGFRLGQRPGLRPLAITPTTIPKYVSTMPIPPAMPQAGTFSGYDYYTIAAGYFRQQILPSTFPSTPVFGYGAVGNSATFSAPGPTIEATTGRPVRVKWVNQLVTSANNYVAPLVQVTPTWHWANPPGGTSGRDGHGTGTSYTGPTPIVPHLHGSHTYDWSDGYPEAWFLPAAANIPAGYATTGTFYGPDSTASQNTIGLPWGNGYSVYQYTNDQAATTLWYHDHTLGMTHCNVESGLAGFYLLRGGSADLPSGVLPGPAPRAGDPAGTSYYEIPIVIQDKSFNPDGTIVPQVDFFGNTITVNGKTWPSLPVEARRYRFRILNGSMVRTYVLKIASNPTATRSATPALPFWQIGADGGFLPPRRNSTNC